MHTFSILFDICVFWVVISFRRSTAADYRYEECGPMKCREGGPNISFPFHISGLQDPYCGYPASEFTLNCSDNGFPVLHLGESVYAIEHIFYESRSFRVFNSVFINLNNSSSSCVPRFRNTSLSTTSKFKFGDNVKDLHLFSNCTDSNLERERVFCDERESRGLTLYEGDEHFADAVEECGTNLVAPVEVDEGGNRGISDVIQDLRRGFVINWVASHCSDCRQSGGYCGFNETEFVFKCFCQDRPHSRSCKPEKDRSKLILVTAISGGGVFILLCLSISLIIWRCKKRFVRPYLSRNISCDPYSKSDIEGGNSYFGIPIFSYKELLEATNNFDSKKELGDGGFGTVYLGKLQDGREVAVKRLYERNFKRVEQFMNEVEILTKLRHKNLVSLYGCTSRRSRELLLVYEYISNGTVADHLHGERANEAPLTWAVRMKIAIETASALAYLHKSDIIHRDVKTNNILLDDNFCVKVADFGLSRLFPNDVTHISTAPQGTPGYVDPDYHQCYQLNDKSDVYSFGVVLIELVSSMPAVDISRHTSEINLASLAVNRIQRSAFDELIDASLGYKTDADVLRMATLVAELAFRCLQLEKDMRPSMDEVLNLLKEFQGGDKVAFEAKKEGSFGDGKIPPSPETEDVTLLKLRNFQSSPNAVTDRWISGSSTASSYHMKSVEL
ncbi:hypothetical protein ACS0TY_008365 [Phlomoides rotata]